MTRYKPLDTSEGPEYMQHVWGLTFKPIGDENFFVEQWQGHVQRAATEFWGPSIIFLALNPELLELFAQDQEMCAFGAYNQVSVCQMRARGTITREDDDAEIGDLRKRLLKNLESGRLFRDEDIAQARELIEKGEPFCFHPTQYAYAMYERG